MKTNANKTEVISRTGHRTLFTALMGAALRVEQFVYLKSGVFADVSPELDKLILLCLRLSVRNAFFSKR